MQASIIFLLAACSFSRVTEKEIPVSIIPTPKEISVKPLALSLPKTIAIHSETENSQPIVALLTQDLESFQISVTTDDAETTILLAIDPALDADKYTLEVNENVILSGGSIQALTMARSTLLQLLYTESGNVWLPIVNITDQPDTQYRGLMIDLARKWHPFEDLIQLVELAAYYKVNYLQLHFTDYQSYTLPSDVYPKLPSPDRNYPKADLKELVAYAQLRGITIIPEIDIPGHALSIVEAYPDLFGIKARDKNPWIINMGKEEVYEALDKIIADVAPIFKDSPYFHIGGDEAIFDYVLEDPDVQAYMSANNLGEDVHDLYRHFLVRMNEIVKKQGFQMCVWEGFRPDGLVDIPKDIIVYEFETNRYLPNQLVADGYTVVNTSWKPLYVVNQKKWEPETIYNWNLWKWENWWPRAPSIKPIQVAKSPLVIGAQMCSWEQPSEVEFKSLRKRLPVMIERIWNVEQKLPYASFMEELTHTDDRLSILVKDSSQDSLLIGHNYVAPDPE